MTKVKSIVKVKLKSVEKGERDFKEFLDLYQNTYTGNSRFDWSRSEKLWTMSASGGIVEITYDPLYSRLETQIHPDFGVFPVSPFLIERYMDKSGPMLPATTMTFNDLISGWVTPELRMALNEACPNVYFAQQAVSDPTQIGFFSNLSKAMIYDLLWRQEGTSDSELYREKNAVMTRPGRFFKKFGIDDVQELETITARFRSYDFVIVTGEDVRRYYKGTNYTHKSRSTMHSSCMRGDDCQEFFDLYVMELSMLVVLDEDGYVTGRALIWPNMTIEVGGIEYVNQTFLDRIYGSPALVHGAKEYALEHGWWRKTEQNYCSHEKVIDPQGEQWTGAKLTYKSNRVYESYPYMDTMYGLVDDGVMNNQGYGRELTDLDGNWEDAGYTCVECGDRLEEGDGQIANGDLYCSYCFDERFTHCADCGDVVDNDDVYIIDGDTYCHNCTSGSSCCDECGETTFAHLQWLDGEGFCESCCESTTVTRDCIVCGNPTGVRELLENGGSCATCNEENNEETQENATA